MKHILLISIITIFTFGCAKENEFTDSIYVPDDENPGLPAYTEQGYNTFGANYERIVYTYTNEKIPLKVIARDSNVTFLFQGRTNGYEGTYINLSFTLPDSGVSQYQNILKYNDTIIDLSRNDIEVKMTFLHGNSGVDTNIVNGNLYFKKSQAFFVDDIESGIILSGYFELMYVADDIPYKMSDGRFDFTVNNFNFFKL